MMGERSLRMDILSIYVPSFFIFLGMSIISPILPIYAESFNVNYTMVSLAISMYAFGRFMADVPVGLLSDKVGRRLMMVCRNSNPHRMQSAKRHRTDLRPVPTIQVP